MFQPGVILEQPLQADTRPTHGVSRHVPTRLTGTHQATAPSDDTIPQYGRIHSFVAML